MRKVLAVVLAVCLLLPCVSTIVWAGSGAYETLASVPYVYNAVNTVDDHKEIYSYGTTFDPIDLTKFGYPTSGVIEEGVLGLQMDLCVSGKDKVVKAMETVSLNGQLEISSGGTCDKEELNVGVGVLEWKANAWNRVVIDLGRIKAATGDTFDPTNFNYMRMYVGGLGEYLGEVAYVKVANVQIVDLKKPLAEAPALGDGTAGDQVPPQSIVYDAPAYKELASFPYKGMVMTYASGEVYSVGTALPEGIDLTKFGYPTSGAIEPGKLGLQLDYYISGDENAVQMLEKGQLSGQIEVASGGACDVQEMSTVPTRLKGKDGEWVRVFLDFSWFTGKTGGTFNPKNFNFFRMYLSVATNHPDESLAMRVVNLRVVDFTQPLSEEEAPVIGDGTFTPDPPVYTAQKVPAGYVTDTAVVAGYNLKEYALSHDMTDVTDWSPIIQSLLYALAERGGGMLYIPAGTYPCYSGIILPNGVTLQGDWANPDVSITVTGTILAVYDGENQAAGSFVKMMDNSYLRSMAFWYPNQNPSQPIAYPYTISMGSTCHLKDITLVNSYYGITNHGASCPDTENIYGTPLAVGMDLDMISDSYGMENVNFSPDYWINSGLPGAPTAAADQAALMDTLYYGATAITIRRMDWSWTTYSTIKGYSVGIYFAKSNGGDWYPNGQCYDITFENCYTALQVDGMGGAGMVMNGFKVKNCEFGVFFSGATTERPGQLAFFNADIAANSAVISEHSRAKLAFTNSVIRRGDVRVKGGYLTFLNSKFHTAAPHITLEQGTQAAMLAAVTDAWGERVQVDNKAFCPLAQEDKNPITETMPIITREQGLYQYRRVASSAVTVAHLDNNGETDVSAALNALLQAQAATGGTVFVPPGFYRIDNAITVPTGVELLGSLDFGQAEMYNGVGTIFQIYHGRNEPEAATIILEAGAGVRGLQINYPEQNFVGDSFVPYAHTIQGRGEGAYVINVSSRNSWSGVDFMTYRCDNHYIDSFRGNALKSYVAVGGGAKNGIVRNCHLQYTSWTYGDDGRRGGWPRVVEDKSIEAREAWRMDLYIFSGHNLDNYTIGHVENQLHFGNMNYCGYTGINIVPEETGLADVTVWGQNTDCCTISMNIEAAKRVDFINLQTTAFTWVPERQTAEMNLIHLGKECDIAVNVFGGALYETPDYMFNVENGTLNIYSAEYHSSAPMNKVGENATINLVDFYMANHTSGFYGKPAATELTLATAYPENVHLSYSLYRTPLLQTDELGECLHVYEATTDFRLDVAENMQIPEDSTIVFSEAFTDYASLPDTLKRVTARIAGDGKVTARRGMMQITHGGVTLTAGILAEKQFALTKGTYRVETRLNLTALRQTAMSQFVMALCDENGESVPLVRFDKSGALEAATANGWKTVGTFAPATWYRLGLMVNMDDGTVAAYLMDDNYNTVAASGELPLDMQTVTGVFMYADAGFEDNTKTDVQVDYLAVIDTEVAYGAAGDVNGDGRVDSTDARLVLQYAVGKIDAAKLAVGAADVDGNNKVDSTDARLILQYAVGKIKGF